MKIENNEFDSEKVINGISIINEINNESFSNSSIEQKVQ